MLTVGVIWFVQKEDDRLSKASKRPNSRNSSKSKTSAKDSVANDISEEVLEEPETYWPVSFRVDLSTPGISLL